MEILDPILHSGLEKVGGGRGQMMGEGGESERWGGRGRELVRGGWRGKGLDLIIITNFSSNAMKFPIINYLAEKLLFFVMI
jgi:hypothetical protein